MRSSEYVKPMKEISQLIDFNELESCCSASEEDLSRDMEEIAPNLWFKDNNSNVLAVAHMDSVCKPSHFKHVQLNEKETLIFSPVLDDRLGVYIITKLLPLMHVNTDILLTTNEELGASTAVGFFTHKEYNWGVEFDREGDEVVVYDYNNTEWRQCLKKFGFHIGVGTFSDISYLEEVGCCFANIGTGLRHGHTELAHSVMNVMLLNVTRFFYMYLKYRNVRFEHDFPWLYKHDDFSSNTRYDYYRDKWEDGY